MLLTNLSTSNLVLISVTNTTYNVAPGTTQEILNGQIPDAQLSLLISKNIISITGYTPGQGGGGGGGGDVTVNTIQDTICIDDSSTLFIKRASGTSPPTFATFRFDNGNTYAPSANPRPIDASLNLPLISGERPLLNALATISATSGYVRVPASSAALVLTGAGAGAMGDTINRLIITVTTEATSAVSLTDGVGTGPSLNAYTVFPAGMDIGCHILQLGDLTSNNGPWKVTTGAGVSVVAVGIFS